MQCRKHGPVVMVIHCSDWCQEWDTWNTVLGSQMLEALKLEPSAHSREFHSKWSFCADGNNVTGSGSGQRRWCWWRGCWNDRSELTTVTYSHHALYCAHTWHGQIFFSLFFSCVLLTSMCVSPLPNGAHVLSVILLLWFLPQFLDIWIYSQPLWICLPRQANFSFVLCPVFWSETFFCWK